MDTIQATGPGGPRVFKGSNSTETTGATISGNIQDDSDKAALAHGLVMALVTLLIAPVDMLTASVLRRWPAVHMVTSAGYLVCLMGGFGIGVKISAEYLAVSSLEASLES